MVLSLPPSRGKIRSVRGNWLSAGPKKKRSASANKRKKKRISSTLTASCWNLRNQLVKRQRSKDLKIELVAVAHLTTLKMVALRPVSSRLRAQISLRVLQAQKEKRA